MAGCSSRESMLLNTILNHLKCPICTLRYNKPKVLDCHHTFCLQCLQELQAVQKPDDQEQDDQTLTCPLCKIITIVRAEEIETLPTNLIVYSMVEDVEWNEALLKGQREEFKCQNCDEGNKSIALCKDCKQRLCRECRQTHDRMSAMRRHRVYDLKPEDTDNKTSDQRDLVKRPHTQHDRVKKQISDWKLWRQYDEAHVIRAAIYSDDELIFCSRNKQDLVRIRLDEDYDNTSLHRQTFLGLSEVISIAVNPRDHLFVLDTFLLHVFNRDGELVCKFPPGNSDDKPMCLTSMMDTLIAVGYANRSEITIHEYTDGCHVNTIPVPPITQYITSYHNYLIYITSETYHLEAVSLSTDEKVFTVDISSHLGIASQSPKGLCCDEEGNIYLATWGPLISDIHCYSMTGQYLGCIIEDCGQPYDLAITSDKKLAVAALSIKIYEHVPSSSSSQLQRSSSISSSSSLSTQSLKSALSLLSL